MLKFNEESKFSKVSKVSKFSKFSKFDSKIVKKDEQIKFAKETLAENKQFELLYRGSADGFEASTFHQKCDGKKDTISFIETSNGEIIGGYTSEPWKSDYKFVKDDKAYIFSLNHLQKYKIKNGKYAI